jgi:urate oxidase
MKVTREAGVHTVKELTIGVGLQGDFTTSYTAGDNHLVVPTDTIKNTVTALARDHLEADAERFLLFLGRHFVSTYPQVHTASLTSTERVWQRLSIGAEPHPHSFSANDTATPFCEVTVTKESHSATSGIEHLLLLKSTASSFVDFPRDRFTTLPEVTDRVLATSLRASWKWDAEPHDYHSANQMIVHAMLVPFANNHSPSAQTTLFQMGTAALEACREISEVHLTLPNKHYLLVPLEPFGMGNENEIFLPTDEPHGQIEATVTR